ncbi:MAG: 1,6-anhydro-N-acetylmuramyl-L-alanine amidase AmpD [Arenicellales bacterium]
MKLDQNSGLLDGAEYVPSPNQDERPDPMHIDTLIIHAISLPPDCFGGCHVEELFTNCLNPDQHDYFAEIQDLRVSAHFLIKREGQLLQFVPTTMRAWHAGESCFQGCEKVNDFSIGIELEGCDTVAFEEAQYARLAAVTQSIREAYPAITLNRIVGHSDVSPGRKTDPGPSFDWPSYRKRLKT